MRTMISGLSALLLASVAMPLAAQMQTPVPAPAAGAATPAPAMTEAERKASAERTAAQEKQAEAERKASEERMKEQEKQAEKERKAAEKQAEAERKAAEKAAAEAAAAEKLAADKAAADAAAAQKAAAATAAAAAPMAVPLSKDSRDRVVQVCTAEAQRRGKALGAADVSLEDVKDTDVKSDGRASMQAKMNIYTKDSKGRVKKQSKKVSCETKNDVVTSFKVN